MAFSTCTQLDQNLSSLSTYTPTAPYLSHSTSWALGTAAHRWRLPLAGEPAPSGEPPAVRVGLSFPSLSLRLPGKPGAVPSSHVSRLVLHVLLAISMMPRISICRERSAGLWVVSVARTCCCAQVFGRPDGYIRRFRCQRTSQSRR